MKTKIFSPRFATVLVALIVLSLVSVASAGSEVVKYAPALGVRVRADAGLGSAIVRTLSCGTAVPYDPASLHTLGGNDWAKLTDGSGWVATNVLTDKPNCTKTSDGSVKLYGASLVWPMADAMPVDLVTPDGWSYGVGTKFEPADAAEVHDFIVNVLALVTATFWLDPDCTGTNYGDGAYLYALDRQTFVAQGGRYNRLAVFNGKVVTVKLTPGRYSLGGMRACPMLPKVESTEGCPVGYATPFGWSRGVCLSDTKVAAEDAGVFRGGTQFELYIDGTLCKVNGYGVEAYLGRYTIPVNTKFHVDLSSYGRDARLGLGGAIGCNAG